MLSNSYFILNKKKNSFINQIFNFKMNFEAYCIIKVLEYLVNKKGFTLQLWIQKNIASS